MNSDNKNIPRYSRLDSNDLSDTIKKNLYDKVSYLKKEGDNAFLVNISGEIFKLSIDEDKMREPLLIDFLFDEEKKEEIKCYLVNGKLYKINSFFEFEPKGFTDKNNKVLFIELVDPLNERFDRYEVVALEKFIQGELLGEGAVSSAYKITNTNLSEINNFIQEKGAIIESKYKINLVGKVLKRMDLRKYFSIKENKGILSLYLSKPIIIDKETDKPFEILMQDLFDHNLFKESFEEYINSIDAIKEKTKKKKLFLRVIEKEKEFMEEIFNSLEEKFLDISIGIDNFMQIGDIDGNFERLENVVSVLEKIKSLNYNFQTDILDKLLPDIKKLLSSEKGEDDTNSFKKTLGSYIGSKASSYENILSLNIFDSKLNIQNYLLPQGFPVFNDGIGYIEYVQKKFDGIVNRRIDAAIHWIQNYLKRSNRLRKDKTITYTDNFGTIKDLHFNFIKYVWEKCGFREVNKIINIMRDSKYLKENTENKKEGEKYFSKSFILFAELLSSIHIIVDNENIIEEEKKITKEESIERASKIYKEYFASEIDISDQDFLLHDKFEIFSQDREFESIDLQEFEEKIMDGEMISEVYKLLSDVKKAEEMISPENIKKDYSYEINSINRGLYRFLPFIKDATYSRIKTMIRNTNLDKSKISIDYYKTFNLDIFAKHISDLFRVISNQRNFDKHIDYINTDILNDVIPGTKNILYEIIDEVNKILIINVLYKNTTKAETDEDIIKRGVFISNCFEHFDNLKEILNKKRKIDVHEISILKAFNKKNRQKYKKYAIDFYYHLENDFNHLTGRNNNSKKNLLKYCYTESKMYIYDKEDDIHEEKQVLLEYCFNILTSLRDCIKRKPKKLNKYSDWREATNNIHKLVKDVISSFKDSIISLNTNIEDVNIDIENFSALMDDLGGETNFSYKQYKKQLKDKLSHFCINIQEKIDSLFIRIYENNIKVVIRDSLLENTCLEALHKEVYLRYKNVLSKLFGEEFIETNTDIVMTKIMRKTLNLSKPLLYDTDMFVDLDAKDLEEIFFEIADYIGEDDNTSLETVKYLFACSLKHRVIKDIDTNIEDIENIWGEIRTAYLLKRHGNLSTDFYFESGELNVVMESQESRNNGLQIVEKDALIKRLLESPESIIKGLLKGEKEISPLNKYLSFRKQKDGVDERVFISSISKLFEMTVQQLEGYGLAAEGQNIILTDFGKIQNIGFKTFINKKYSLKLSEYAENIYEIVKNYCKRNGILEKEFYPDISFLSVIIKEIRDSYNENLDVNIFLKIRQLAYVLYEVVDEILEKMREKALLELLQKNIANQLIPIESEVVTKYNAYLKKRRLLLKKINDLKKFKKIDKLQELERSFLDYSTQISKAFQIKSLRNIYEYQTISKMRELLLDKSLISYDRALIEKYLSKHKKYIIGIENDISNLKKDCIKYIDNNIIAKFSDISIKYYNKDRSCIMFPQNNDDMFIDYRIFQPDKYNILTPIGLEVGGCYVNNITKGRIICSEVFGDPLIILNNCGYTGEEYIGPTTVSKNLLGYSVLAHFIVSGKGFALETNDDITICELLDSTISTKNHMIEEYFAKKTPNNNFPKKLVEILDNNKKKEHNFLDKHDGLLYPNLSVLFNILSSYLYISYTDFPEDLFRKFFRLNFSDRFDTNTEKVVLNILKEVHQEIHKYKEENGANRLWHIQKCMVGVLSELYPESSTYINSVSLKIEFIYSLLKNHIQMRILYELGYSKKEIFELITDLGIPIRDISSQLNHLRSLLTKNLYQYLSYDTREKSKSFLDLESTKTLSFDSSSKIIESNLTKTDSTSSEKSYVNLIDSFYSTFIKDIDIFDSKYSCLYNKILYEREFDIQTMFDDLEILKDDINNNLLKKLEQTGDKDNIDSIIKYIDKIGLEPKDNNFWIYDTNLIKKFLLNFFKDNLEEYTGEYYPLKNKFIDAGISENFQKEFITKNELLSKAVRFEDVKNSDFFKTLKTNLKEAVELMILILRVVSYNLNNIKDKNDKYFIAKINDIYTYIGKESKNNNDKFLYENMNKLGLSKKFIGKILEFIKSFVLNKINDIKFDEYEIERLKDIADKISLLINYESHDLFVEQYLVNISQKIDTNDNKQKFKFIRPIIKEIKDLSNNDKKDIYYKVINAEKYFRRVIPHISNYISLLHQSIILSEIPAMTKYKLKYELDILEIKLIEDITDKIEEKNTIGYLSSRVCSDIKRFCNENNIQQPEFDGLTKNIEDGSFSYRQRTGYLYTENLISRALLRRISNIIDKYYKEQEVLCKMIESESEDIQINSLEEDFIKVVYRFGDNEVRSNCLEKLSRLPEREKDWLKNVVINTILQINNSYESELIPLIQGIDNPIEKCQVLLENIFADSNKSSFRFNGWEKYLYYRLKTVSISNRINIWLDIYCLLENNKNIDKIKELCHHKYDNVVKKLISYLKGRTSSLVLPDELKDMYKIVTRSNEKYKKQFYRDINRLFQDINLEKRKIRSEKRLLEESDFKDINKFIDQLSKKKKNPVSEFLYKNLPENIKLFINKKQSLSINEFLKALNQLISETSLFSSIDLKRLDKILPSEFSILMHISNKGGVTQENIFFLKQIFEDLMFDDKERLINFIKGKIDYLSSKQKEIFMLISNLPSSVIVADIIIDRLCDHFIIEEFDKYITSDDLIQAKIGKVISIKNFVSEDLNMFNDFDRAQDVLTLISEMPEDEQRFLLSFLSKETGDICKISTSENNYEKEDDFIGYNTSELNVKDIKFDNFDAPSYSTAIKEGIKEKDDIIDKRQIYLNKIDELVTKDDVCFRKKLQNALLYFLGLKGNKDLSFQNYRLNELLLSQRINDYIDYDAEINIVFMYNKTTRNNAIKNYQKYREFDLTTLLYNKEITDKNSLELDKYIDDIDVLYKIDIFYDILKDIPKPGRKGVFRDTITNIRENVFIECTVDTFRKHIETIAGRLESHEIYTLLSFIPEGDFIIPKGLLNILISMEIEILLKKFVDSYKSSIVSAKHFQTLIPIIYNYADEDILKRNNVYIKKYFDNKEHFVLMNYLKSIPQREIHNEMEVIFAHKKQKNCFNVLNTIKNLILNDSNCIHLNSKKICDIQNKISNFNFTEYEKDIRNIINIAYPDINIDNFCEEYDEILYKILKKVEKNKKVVDCMYIFLKLMETRHTFGLEIIEEGKIDIQVGTLVNYPLNIEAININIIEEKLGDITISGYLNIIESPIWKSLDTIYKKNLVEIAYTKTRDKLKTIFDYIYAGESQDVLNTKKKEIFDPILENINKVLSGFIDIDSIDFYLLKEINKTDLHFPDKYAVIEHIENIKK